MDEDGANTLQDRLRMMKAISFAQNRELLLKQRAFSYWTDVIQSKKQHAIDYYKMVLFVKGFKGIMEFVMANREAQMQQQQQKQRELLQLQHQMEVKTKSLERIRKRRHFSVFSRVVKEDIRSRLEREKLERDKLEKARMQQRIPPVQNTQKYSKTEFPIRTKQINPAQKTNLDKTAQDLLQNSRRSIISQGLQSQDSFKRRYIPIKSLPPKPMTIITQNQPQTSIKQTEKQIKQQQQFKPQPQKVISHPLQQPLESPPSVIPSKIPESKRQKESQPQVSKLKQQILGLLSEIKMIEVSSLSEMVEQHGKAFKGETSISQKHLIREGLKILSRISLIQ